jgi:hypothetical protein
VQVLFKEDFFHARNKAGEKRFMDFKKSSVKKSTERSVNIHGEKLHGGRRRKKSIGKNIHRGNGKRTVSTLPMTTFFSIMK